MQARLSGVSKAVIKALEAHKLTVDLSSASKLEIADKSSAHTVEVNLSGASKYIGGTVAAVKAKANASGASHVTLNAQENLEVRANGASHVRYDGNPRISQHSSGSLGIEAG